MERRQLLKGLGGVAGAATVGGIAFSGSAAASDATLEGPDKAITATTDGGDIQYVAYGGRLRFTWDGLDTEATHGEYIVESRIRDTGGSFTGWRHHGAGSGPLGDEEGEKSHDGDGTFEEGEKNSGGSWGGPNDSNSGPGSDGFYQFKFGSPYDQPNYAVAYEGDAPDGTLGVKNPWSPTAFEEATDGDTRSKEIEIRKTCRVYDGDPSNSDSKVLVHDSDSAVMTVEVTNRKATGTAGGELSGTVGADES